MLVLAGCCWRFGGEGGGSVMMVVSSEWRGGDVIGRDKG